MARKKTEEKYYKLSRKEIIGWIIGICFALVWMFGLGVWVGQEVIYLPDLPKIKIPFGASSSKTSSQVGKKAKAVTPKRPKKGNKKVKSITHSPKSSLEVKPKTSLKTASPKPSSQPQYSIRVGAFKNKQNALRMQEKLKSQGYKSYITSAKIKNEIFYRVFVGPYSLKKALSYYNQLATQNYQPTRPMPLR